MSAEGRERAGGRAWRLRDTMHHNSPLKAAVGHMPRYFQPGAPQLEGQVCSVTDLMARDRCSPSKAMKNRENIEAELLRDDVMDLSINLNESMMLYDNLQQEADGLLQHDSTEDQKILAKLEKIQVKQQQLLKMQRSLQKKLMARQPKSPMKSIKETANNQETLQSRKQSTADPVIIESLVHNSSTTTEKERDDSESKLEQYTASTATTQVPTGETNMGKAASTGVVVSSEEILPTNVTATQQRVPTTDTISPKHKLTTDVMSPECSTKDAKIATDAIPINGPSMGYIASTPKVMKPFVPCTPASQYSTLDTLILPTPVTLASAKTSIDPAKFFPAIRTPLSMRDMAKRRSGSLGEDSLGSPDTPDDIADSYSIDKSVLSHPSESDPLSPAPMMCRKLYSCSDCSPASSASPLASRSPMVHGSPMGLLLGSPGSPGSPVRMRGSMSLAGNMARYHTPSKAVGMLLPAAVHRFHEALLDEEVSLYMLRCLFLCIHSHYFYMTYINSYSTTNVYLCLNLLVGCSAIPSPVLQLTAHTIQWQKYLQ